VTTQIESAPKGQYAVGECLGRAKLNRTPRAADCGIARVSVRNASRMPRGSAADSPPKCVKSRLRSGLGEANWSILYQGGWSI
jgi:hypothetical protein